MNGQAATLQERVERLERRNRVLAAAVGACVTLLLLAAAGPVTTIEAQGLRLLDDDGRVLVELGRRDDAAGLYILDGNGVPRVTLRHAPDESGLLLSDEQGVTRVGAVQFAHGGGGFALHGAGSRGAAVLYYRNGGSLAFYDEDGALRQRVPD